MLKILFSGYRDPLHSSAGGYDWISKMPQTEAIFADNVPFGFIPQHKRGKFINVFFLELVSKFKARKFDILHHFYGDNLKLKCGKSNNYKTVATVHMDIKGRKNQDHFIRVLRSLDGVIVLSTSQKRELKKYGINAEFIPHGFNKPAFEKIETGVDHSKLNIVVSGSNYRDIDTLLKTVKKCLERRPDIVFHLLGQPKEIKDILTSYNNCICYKRLDDNTYYSLISDCDYNFLPLTFATANNALLEAQFLGVTSILPNISGISDYAAPPSLNIYYNTQEELDNIFVSLTKSAQSDAIVNYAKRFEWCNIYPLLYDYYKSLL